jgi:glycolate oxidase FAD binding subunit
MEEKPFEAIVGAEHCTVPEGQELDGTPISLVVQPGEPQEVARCLAEAQLRGCPIVVSGTGSKLAWGNRTDADELVCLKLSRLDQEMDLQAEEGVVTVRAGVTVETLTRVAAEKDMRTLLCETYPEASVGGTIASDPIGLDIAPDWRLRNDVLGVQVAHPNGELTRAGGKVVKNVSGLDLVRLYCGSLGTLGVITEATLRLRPLPETQVRLRRDFKDREEALSVGREIIPLEPRCLVLLPDEAQASVIWVLEGTEADVARRAEAVEGTPVGCEELEAAGREVAGLTPRPRGSVRMRIAARSSDTLPICEEVVTLGGQKALRLALPRMGVVLAELPEASLQVVFERADQAHWTVFVERAEPECKVGIDVFGLPPDSLSLMRALKQRFDPQRILSPGRFVGWI